MRCITYSLTGHCPIAHVERKKPCGQRWFRFAGTDEPKPRFAQVLWKIYDRIEHSPPNGILVVTCGMFSIKLPSSPQPNNHSTVPRVAGRMVVQIASIRVISFFLLTACWAFCQSELPSPDLLQEVQFGLSSPEVQRQEMLTWRSLPDAPSAQGPTRAEKFHAFVEEARSPLTLGAVAINVRVMREEQHLTPGMQPSFTSLYRTAVLQKESSVFFGKYLYPLLLRQDPRYHASTSDTIIGRATYAASRVLITHNDSGKRTVNISYLLGVLTSAAVAAAYRPYWARSPSTTFKDLGSTIGSDAGINVLHEFWPGIRQVLKRHSPKFVSRIEKRITSDQTPPEVVSTPAR